jgi:hypothetical protein
LITIGFTLDDLDFVIDLFQFAGMDGVITMVNNTVTVTIQHLYKAGHVPFDDGCFYGFSATGILPL